MAAKKKRRTYDPKFRVDSVRQYYAAKEKDTKLSVGAFAATLGIDDSVLAGWCTRYRHLFSTQPPRFDRLTADKREAVLEVMKKEKPRAQIAKERGTTLATLDGWAMRYGDRLRAEMGLTPAGSVAEPSAPTDTKTLVSSGPPHTKNGKRLGRPTNAEQNEKRDAWRTAAGIVKAPADAPDRQPSFPFVADPVQRESPQPRTEPASTTPSEFLRTATEKALRERDAVLLTLEIMMREGRLPGAR
jgi:hypothetical protein